jgi:hypothetical protein
MDQARLGRSERSVLACEDDVSRRVVTVSDPQEAP